MGILITNDSFNLTNDINGRNCLSLRKTDSETISNIKNLDFQRLRLETDVQDLHFLAHIYDKVEEFTCEWGAKDLTGLESLVNLTSLSLQIKTNKHLHFNIFKRLNWASIKWQKNYNDDLFSLYNLHTLLLSGYLSADVSIFSKLVNLNFLQLEYGKTTNLTSLKKLNKLETLYLTKIKDLETLDGIQNSKITILSIAACNNIQDIELIGDIKNLKKLILNITSVESLSFLKHCKNLEQIELQNTNVKDGDLSVLKNIPSLKKVYFKNKKHYTHKCNDFNNT